MCTEVNSDAIVYRDFGDRSNNIKGTHILDSLYGAIELNVVDNLLLIRLKGEENMFSVFNSRDLSFIQNFGFYGDGPDEWKAPRFCGQYTNSSTSYFIWFNDIFKHRFMLVEMKGGEVHISKEYFISPLLNLDRDLFYLDSNLLVGNNGMDAIQKARLCYYNPVEDTCSFTWNFPLIEDEHKLTRNEKFDIFYDHLKMKPDGSSFVSAFERFDRIDKLDVQGNIVLSVLGNDRNGYAKSELSDYKTSKGLKSLNYFYTWLQVTNENIYALYSNQVDDDYNVVPEQVEIHVFDWELNSVHKFIIDDYLICFAVDEINGSIYGFDYYNEKILKYTIPKMYNDTI